MSRTFASLFSGGGLADVGMMAAGWVPLWGIELREDIAACYRENIHACIMVGDVCRVDFAGLERPDHLHASPPCTRASVANSDAKESPLDGELAEAVCRAIRVLRPDTFSLENVYGYRKFKAYQAILRTICDAGYEFEQHHCNAALYGVPQTRMRLILRASRNGRLKPLQPTHSPSPQSQGLFHEHAPLLPWNGWYASIEDLIPMLPASSFAPWQLMRLKDVDFLSDFLQMTGNTQMENPTGTGENARPAPANTVLGSHGTRVRAFLVDGDGNRSRPPTVLDDADPSMTVQAWHMRRPIQAPRAFLCNESSTLEMRAAAGSAAAQVSSERNGRQKAFIVEGTAAGTNNKFDLPVRQEAEPIFTVRGSNPVRAFLVDGKPANFDGDISLTGSASETPTLTASQEKHPFRAWLDQGRTVSMTPRALARFQSVPDHYTLPTKSKLATVVLGNGVPCLMMQRIAESL